MYNKEVQLAISLFEAIDDVNLSNIIVLIEKHNADPNVIIPKLQIAPIHFAVGFENVSFAEKVTELFLKKKADPNLFSECLESRLTPLHIACIYGRTNIVKLLLNHNGDVSLKCNEGITPIQYAIQENHYEVINIIKNHIFEEKIERKKKEILAARSQKLEVPKTPAKNELFNDGTPVKNAVTNAIQNIEHGKFTPNRINYNFDATSPYFINITHRRHKKSKSYNESQEPTENEVQNEKKNLFELTEENVKAFSKLMQNPIVIQRIAIHKRKSYIAAWRDQIQQIQKDNRIDKSYINYLNTCNDVTLLNRSNDSAFDETTRYEVASSSDSFLTANSDLNRHNNAMIDLVPQKSSEYIENYEEDYIHSDAENGIVLYEKKIISKSRENLNRLNDCAISDSSLSTIVTIPPLDYDTDTLRMELKSFGDNPGPITKSTKKLYLKKLVKFKKYPNRLGIVPEVNSRITYPLELQRTVTNYDYLEQNITDYLKLEERMVKHFSEKNHLKWREGNSKTSFVYLLLDPRITSNMSIHQKQLSKSELWQKFLNAIFYVGKGKSVRPYSHLYDAIKIYSRNAELNDYQNYDQHKFGKMTKMCESKKLKRIIEIWKENYGVVCLHIFHNIMPSEAYSREACIIEALGMHNLTNLKRGDYYGAATAYTMREKRQMGIALLHRALHVYLAEGESQMKPDDF
ncbi:ankyrin repeat and LEM domain-containing protein 1-like [Chironomus tepperi]|uniref:ankyrin repeat and LEM domain-containing protein 1-like n=1 Tax=Chironomus tepperi TaxID=113505 RepID=UPI00391F7E1C